MKSSPSERLFADETTQLAKPSAGVSPRPEGAGLYCSCHKGCGSVAQIRAAPAGRCRVASRLRQRPKNCQLNCCASMHNLQNRTCCDRSEERRVGKVRRPKCGM